MQKYNIPTLYEHYQLGICIATLVKLKPEFFYDDLSIGAVYGNFQYCIWDGGRNFIHYCHTTKEEIKMIHNIYNNILNIPMRFIFTNSLLQEEHLKDHLCNMVLQICDNPINEVVFNAPIMEDFISTNYPNYKLILSTTKCTTDIQLAHNDLMNPKYSLVCLDYNLNHNQTLLNSLSQEEKDKTEFLVNAICPPGCPNRKQHYFLVSQRNINFDKPYRMYECNIKKNSLYPSKYSSIITPEEIQSIYVPNGFSNFKIEGRTLYDLEAELEIVKYIVKPDFYFYVIGILEYMRRNFELETYSLEKWQKELDIY